MRIVCISDTHTRHDALAVPDGDVLVHTGDFTRVGAEADVRAFDQWLGTLPHREKVVVAGNHDFCFERRADARGWITNARYLEDEGAVVAGLSFWGSPWTPRFFDWAFNLDRGAPLREKWARVPDGVDVLLTHGPPFGILDRTETGLNVGCDDLRAALDRVRPRLHVFGHIHEGWGERVVGDTRFVNASACDVRYRCVQGPIVVDL